MSNGWKEDKGAKGGFDSRIEIERYPVFVGQCRMAANHLQRVTGAISWHLQPEWDADGQLVVGCHAEFAWQGRIFAVVEPRRALYEDHPLDERVLIHRKERGGMQGKPLLRDLSMELERFIYFSICVEESVLKSYKKNIVSMDIPSDQ